MSNPTAPNPPEKSAQKPVGYSLRGSVGDASLSSFGSMDSIDEIADLLTQARSAESVETEAIQTQTNVSHQAPSTAPKASSSSSDELKTRNAAKSKSIAAVAKNSTFEAPTKNPQAQKPQTKKTPTQKLRLPETIRKPQSFSNQPAAVPTQARSRSEARSRSAPPMPNRSKGRGFLLFLFLTLFGCAAYFAFSNFLRVESFGIVDGQMISVAAPWEGTVERWLVSEGDEVKQGQILVEINNLLTENQIDALGDELKLSQAELEAEMSKIRFNYHEHDERNRVREQRLQSDLTRAQGDLNSELVKLESFKREYLRAKKLAKHGSVSNEGYEKALYDYAGQRKKVVALRETVRVFEEQQNTPAVENSDRNNNGSPQLKPILAKIEMTKSEIRRLREKLELGQLKAPCDGKITQRLCLSGEPTKASVPVAEILKNNSVEAVLYVPQTHTDKYQPGDRVEVILDPYPEPMGCVVDRIGESYEPAPRNIARFYSYQQFLLPVYLKPDSASQRWMALRLNGTIRREFDLQNGLHNAVDESRSWTSELSNEVKNAYQSFFAKIEVKGDQ